jgi:hypothetical protein
MGEVKCRLDRTTARTPIYTERAPQIEPYGLTEKENEQEREQTPSTKKASEQKRANTTTTSTALVVTRLREEVGGRTSTGNLSSQQNSCLCCLKRLPLRQNVLRDQIQCGPVYSYIYAAKFRFTDTETQVHHILPSIT